MFYLNDEQMQELWKRGVPESYGNCINVGEGSEHYTKTLLLSDLFELLHKAGIKYKIEFTGKDYVLTVCYVQLRRSENLLTLLFETVIGIIDNYGVEHLFSIEKNTHK